MMHVISPHLDDAVLSLGQFMCTERCVVTTVLAGVPRPGFLTDYDKSCGFTSSAGAVRSRRGEDLGALAEIGAVPRHLGFLDGQYRDVPSRRIDHDAVVRELEQLMSPRIHTFAPLGIGHPDHRLVARAARDAVPAGLLLLYEELPYRVLWPEQVQDELDGIRREGWDLEVWPLPQGSRALKEAAIGRYRSQFPNGAADPCLLVPERVWRATRGVS